MNVVNWAFKYFSGNPKEFCTPPGSEVWQEFGELDGDDGKPMYLATTYNDGGGTIWICYNGGRWLCHFRGSDARQLAKIILWDWWIVSRWCGLKVKLWNWSLHVKNRREGIGRVRP